MTELNVVAKLRIMPTGVDVDLDKIRDKMTPIVNKFGKFHSSEIKPIAFGLNSLEANVLLNDSRGGIEEIEKEISKIDGVMEVSVIDLNRL